MSIKKKEELRKVPTKNYIALITIFIATFLCKRTMCGIAKPNIPGLFPYLTG